MNQNNNQFIYQMVLARDSFVKNLLENNRAQSFSRGDQRNAYANLQRAQTFGSAEDAEKAQNNLTYICTSRQ